MEELSGQSRTLDWMKGMERRLSSVAVIFETPDDQALIVKANYKPYWSFPGGVIDANETPRQAAVREVEEELGFHIGQDQLSFVMVVDRKSDMAQTYQFVFKVNTPLTEVMQKSITLQQSELTDYMLVRKKEVKGTDRSFGKVISHWANGIHGYVEQMFDAKG